MSRCRIDLEIDSFVSKKSLKNSFETHPKMSKMAPIPAELP